MYTAALLFHLLCVVYWLGSDLVVYLVSGHVLDTRRPLAARMYAAKLMLLADMIPRTCLVLMLASSFTLAQTMGLLAIDGPGLAAIWLFCAAWLAIVWIVHWRERSELGERLKRFDWALRVAIALGLLLLLIGSARRGSPLVDQWWLQAKLGLFATIIVCGLVIRQQLIPFGPLLGKLADGTASAADETAMRRIIAQVKPVVWVIWIALGMAMWFGIAKPL